MKKTWNWLINSPCLIFRLAYFERAGLFTTESSLVSSARKHYTWQVATHSWVSYFIILLLMIGIELIFD
jgi:hypothetical protein